MAFITQAVTVLQTLVIALGAGLAVWGVVNLMEGYGNYNPGANAYVPLSNKVICADSHLLFREFKSWYADFLIPAFKSEKKRFICLKPIDI